MLEQINYTKAEFDIDLKNLKNGKMLSYVSAVKQSVKNIVHTLKGQRIFMDFFGTDIEDYKYEKNLNSPLLSELTYDIETTIKKYETRITLVGVQVKQNNETLIISIGYIINRFNIKDYVNIIF